MDDPVLSDVELVDDDLADDIRRLAQLKQQAKDVKDEIDDLEAYIAKSITKSARVNAGIGVTIVATVVRGTTDRWDEYVLQTAYPNLWAEVTEPKLSKAKLIAAAKAGRVSREAWEAIHHETENKPYVKITKYEETSTDA